MLRRGRNFEHQTLDKNDALPKKQPSSGFLLFSQWKILLFVLILTLVVLYVINVEQVEDNNLPKSDSAKAFSILDASSIGVDTELFDCGGENATCHSFCPLHFFSQGQVGFEFLSDLEKLGGNLPNLPRMTHFSWSSNDGNTTRFEGLPSDITYFHLRKTGGTTIHHALGHLSKFLKSKGYSSKVTRYSTCRGVLREKCQQKAVKHIQSISKDQSTFNNRKHVVFSVVRDPISRFVSTMGQAMDVTLGARLRQECLDESSSKSTIRCVLQHLQKHGLRSDVHFVPMAVNLYALMRNVDIEVSLLSQDHLSRILQNFGVSATAGMHMRNRANQDYLQSKMLAHLSTEDFDSSDIQKICDLYAIDVKMMHSIRLDVALCSTTMKE